MTSNPGAAGPRRGRSIAGAGCVGRPAPGRSPRSRRPSTASTPGSSRGCGRPSCSISLATASRRATRPRGSTPRPPPPSLVEPRRRPRPRRRRPAGAPRRDRRRRARANGRARARREVVGRDVRRFDACECRTARASATSPSCSPSPGVERHVLDLVDRVEGVDARRGPPAAGRCRRAARCERPRRPTATGSSNCERDRRRRWRPDRWTRPKRCRPSSTSSSAELARAFGIGGRERRAASAAERARLNVTRALRTAIVRLADAVPDAGARARPPRSHRHVLRVRGNAAMRFAGSFRAD